MIVIIWKSVDRPYSTQPIFVIGVVSIACEMSNSSPDLINILFSILLVYLKLRLPYLILASAWALWGVRCSVDSNPSFSPSDRPIFSIRTLLP